MEDHGTNGARHGTNSQMAAVSLVHQRAKDTDYGTTDRKLHSFGEYGTKTQIVKFVVHKTLISSNLASNVCWSHVFALRFQTFEND